MKPIAPLLALGILATSCATVADQTQGTPLCSDLSTKAESAPRVPSDLGAPEAWVARLTAEERKRVLLSAAEIEALNRRNLESNRAAYQDVLDPDVALPERIQAEFAERTAWLDAKLESDTYVEDSRGSYARAKARIDASQPIDELRVVAKEADIRCVPMNEGLFTLPRDVAFDRNRCSRVHVGEVLRVLKSADDGAWRYVHAGHSVGWLHQAELSPPMNADALKPFLGKDEHVVMTDDLTEGDVRLRMGRRFPAVRNDDRSWTLELPTPSGMRSLRLGADAPVHEGAMPFTRANLLSLAFARLDEPYGWGGYRGGRDCSRLLLDLFSVFGLRLGRHSLVQADAGTTSVDISGLTPPEKRAALKRGADRGIVLVFMPGHIMLHLGEVDGQPFALSSISEFVTPCSGGDQIVRLDRVAVSDYLLGQGTERRSFIERITKLTIFGGP